MRNPVRTRAKLLDPWRIDATRERLSGAFVSDISKRRSGIACPRCQASMREITRIAPLGHEAGLVAYECSACDYVTSVLVPAGRQTNDDAV
jgi:hypothetical protein